MTDSPAAPGKRIRKRRLTGRPRIGGKRCLEGCSCRKHQSPNKGRSYPQLRVKCPLDCKCGRHKPPPTKGTTSNPRKLYLSDRCDRCGFIAENKCQLDIDHIDGDHSNNDPSNIQTLCANCHRLKTWLNGDGPQYQRREHASTANSKRAYRSTR